MVGLLVFFLRDNITVFLTSFQGLIQSVFELPDGSGVVVTIGKYVTPNHMDINGNGVEPDFRNFPGKTLLFTSLHVSTAFCFSEYKTI